MNRVRMIVSVVVGGVLLTAVPATASAASPSCVGQYASFFAQQDGAVFGADQSFGAQFASMPNYGAGVVAPYAHLPRNTC